MVMKEGRKYGQSDAWGCPLKAWAPAPTVDLPSLTPADVLQNFGRGTLPASRVFRDLHCTMSIIMNIMLPLQGALEIIHWGCRFCYVYYPLLPRRALQAVAVLSPALCTTFFLAEDFQILEGWPGTSRLCPPLRSLNILLMGRCYTGEEGANSRSQKSWVHFLQSGAYLLPLRVVTWDNCLIVCVQPLCLGSVEQSSKPAIHCWPFWFLFIPANVALLYQSYFVLSAALHTAFQMLGVFYVCKEDRWVTCHK